MLELQWQMVEEGIKRLGKEDMLECIYFMRLKDTTRLCCSKGPGDTPYPKAIRNSLVIGVRTTEKLNGGSSLQVMEGC